MHTKDGPSLSRFLPASYKAVRQQITRHTYPCSILRHSKDQPTVKVVSSPIHQTTHPHVQLVLSSCNAVSVRTNIILYRTGKKSQRIRTQNFQEGWFHVLKHFGGIRVARTQVFSSDRSGDLTKKETLCMIQMSFAKVS